MFSLTPIFASSTSFMIKRFKGRSRGQMVLETAFVFTFLIFLVFTIVNFGIIFHTKNIATYSAFMAARSYQVMGDYDRVDSPEELNVYETKDAKGKITPFMDKVTVAAPYMVAEDIFTCALPWVTVPDGEAEKRPEKPDEDNLLSVTSSRCMEGKRKYKNFNVGDAIRFQPFGEDQSSLTSALSGKKETDLNKVERAYTERGRSPLQYGILSMQYKKPILFNPFGVFNSAQGKSKIYVDEVFVPVLLNPGLKSKFKEDEKKPKQFEEDKNGN